MLPSSQRSAYTRQRLSSTGLAVGKPTNGHVMRQLQSRARCLAATNKVELSVKEQQLLQHIMNYQYMVDLPEGQLVISPLREQWLQRSGDLLADTFVDAKNIQPYRRYVRRNIGKYLDQHIKMPPAAVLVTAVLRSEVQGSSAAALGLHDLQEATADTVSDTGSSSSGSSDAAASCTDSHQQADTGTEQRLDPLSHLLLTYLGWLVKPGGPAAQSGKPLSEKSARADTDRSGASSSTDDGGEAILPSQAQPALVDSSSSSLSGSNDGTQSAGTPQDSTSSSSKAGPNIASLMGSALQHLSSGVTLPQLRGQQKATQKHVVETLVGVAEVSFKEHTRSQALTLNPPQQCAYLCNMAVARDWRRKGIASALLTAVEDMCLLAGESDLYLHLRFKDAATAGSLYRKAGFGQRKRDCWLLLLIGQEPRFLMLKQLAAARTLVGKVLLPGFRQGVTAAEVQQQEQELQQQQQVTAAQGSTQAAAAPAASPAA